MNFNPKKLTAWFLIGFVLIGILIVLINLDWWDLAMGALVVNLIEYLTPQWVRVFFSNALYSPANLGMLVVTYWVLNKVLLQKVDVSKEIKEGNLTVTFFVTMVMVAVILSGKTAVGAEKLAYSTPYQGYIDTAHTRFFGKGSEVPARLLTAQFFQESRFNPKAVSPVGARGVAQIMPMTQGDIEKKLGTFNPFNARDSIYAGTYYMANRYHVFRFGNKTIANRYALGASAYNAGLKYILQAQELAGREESQRWSPVAKALRRVPKVYADEPILYVKKIFHYYNNRFRMKRDPILKVT